jgi:hypothetical protein
MRLPARSHDVAIIDGKKSLLCRFAIHAKDDSRFSGAPVCRKASIAPERKAIAPRRKIDSVQNDRLDSTQGGHLRMFRHPSPSFQNRSIQAPVPICSGGSP